MKEVNKVDLDPPVGCQAIKGVSIGGTFTSERPRHRLAAIQSESRYGTLNQNNSVISTEDNDRSKAVIVINSLNTKGDDWFHSEVDEKRTLD